MKRLLVLLLLPSCVYAGGLFNGGGGGSASLPSCAPNQILAGPASGASSATAACRAAVAADAPFTMTQEVGVFASRPSAATAGAGSRYIATDLGPNGCEFRSDGSAWHTDACVLARTYTAGSSTTGDTNEHSVATINVPAGLMTANSIVTVTYSAASSGVVGNKTVRVEYGASTGITGTLCNQTTLTTTNLYGTAMARLVNRNATNSQTCNASQNGGTGVNTTAFVSGSVDTTAAWVFDITIQLVSALDSANLEWYHVTVSN